MFDKVAYDETNNALIDLRNAVNQKKTLKNENPDKIINIVEEIIYFNKQQKGKRRSLGLATRLKILTSK